MPARMTLTAWGQGFKNALVCLAGVVVFWWVIAKAISLIFDQPLSYSFGMAFAVFWSFILLAFLASWLHGRSVAGPVLLDCGPHPTRVLFLVEAVLFLVIGLTGGLAAMSVSKVFSTASPVFGVSFAAYWLILATGRLQIRENGIWQYWSLLRWSKIGSYQWADDSTLLLKPKGFLGLFKGALPVPPEHRQAVAELLAKRCPTRPAAEPDASSR